MSKESKSMNHGAWDGHANEKRFMVALANFMNESWSVVCQVRERYGLSSEYQMSSTEIAKRIDDISKKLDDKYKEVQALEAQKSLLVNKAPVAGPSGAGSSGLPCPRLQNPADFQPLASSTPSRNVGYSGNYTMSHSGGSAGYMSSTAASSGSSPRRRMQFTGSTSGSSCPPSCQEYSEGLSGGYRSFGGVDYGF